jgi:osmotically-inducible protein OsmY
VNNWAQRLAAQEAAHRVAGVLDVANDLEVKVLAGHPLKNDTEIAHMVRHALGWNVFVPEERIKSTVSNGIVTLEGDVDHWSQLDEADKVVRHLIDVRGMVNKIQVKSAKAAASDVQKAIEEALERRAERGARHISLEIHGDRVTLFGTVHSWAERQTAVGAARGTHGVRSVDDRLRIEPYAA